MITDIRINGLHSTRIGDESMGEQIIWIFSGVTLFLLLCCLYALHDARRLSGIVKEKEEKEAKAVEQLEELTKDKELLEIQLEETKKSSEKNHRLAFYDYKTGLPNNLALTELLDGTMKTFRKDEKLVLIYIDLEELERLDRQVSYAYKDELLVDVADRLRQALEENDMLTCVDGGRFIILAQNLDSAEAIEEKLKRIRKLFSYPFVLAATEIFLNINIGICVAPQDGKTAQTLLKNLNTALFAAKRKGRNQYCYFEEELSKAMMSRIELQSQLRNGIEKEEFEVYYQPQVDIKTERVKGFEALVRWNHPTKGVLLPEAFLPLAEDTGLIVTIGKWVVLEACRQLKLWNEAGYRDLMIGMNLSLRQLREKNLTEEIQWILKETGVKPDNILFDIPEQAAVEEPDLTVKRIQELESLGVKISLEHFGLGLCYLEHLADIPIHSFKIDHSFVEKEDERSLPVLMALAKAYGANLVAGGVENEAQKRLLLGTGCDLVQGFLYSEPVGSKEAEEFLKW